LSGRGFFLSAASAPAGRSTRKNVRGSLRS
jgi:hypothetical protein